MMLFFLGHFRYRVHEINRIGKIVELESAFNVLFLQFPFRDSFHALFQLGRFHQVGHNGTTSNTRKSFCNAKTSGFKRPGFCADFSPNRRLRPQMRVLRASGLASSPTNLRPPRPLFLSRQQNETHSRAADTLPRRCPRSRPVFPPLEKPPRDRLTTRFSSLHQLL